MNLKMTVALVAILGAASTPAEASSWKLIGQKEVTDRVDRDILYAPGPRLYRQIRICVSRNPVRFYDVDIRFANFGHQDVAVRSRINAGHCTRVIDLKGGKRDIRSVKFLYEETSVRLRRATVKVFGR